MCDDHDPFRVRPRESQQWTRRQETGEREKAQREVRWRVRERKTVGQAQKVARVSCEEKCTGNREKIVREMG